MANKPLKSLTFPGLSDTYTVPQVDDTLTQAGEAADAKKVGDELADVKSAVTAIDGEIYDYDLMYAETTVSGWRLNESNGLCSSNSGYKLVKYKVTAGEVVKVVSDDRFQFQSAASVPSFAPNNRVGDTTYGVGTFVLTVPNTATYLIVSTPTTSTASASKQASVIDGMSDAVELADDEIAIIKECVGAALTNFTYASGSISSSNGYINPGDSTHTHVMYDNYLKASDWYAIENLQYTGVKMNVLFYSSEAQSAFVSAMNLMDVKTHIFTDTEKGYYFRLSMEARTGTLSTSTRYAVLYKFVPDTIIQKNADKLPAIYAAKNTSNFTILATTDMHGDGRRMFTAIRYLNEAPYINMGVHLGDMSPSTFASSSQYYFDAVALAEKDWFTVIGNHDAGNGTAVSSNGTQAQIYAKYIEPVLDQIGVETETAYYYKDYATPKLRIFVLNCSDLPDTLANETTFAVSRGVMGAFSQAQITWFVNALADTPSNYHVMIMMHYVNAKMVADTDIKFQSSGFSHTGDTNNAYVGIIPEIIEAWKAGTTLEKTYTSEVSGMPDVTVDADFSSRGTGIFVGVLAGHTHRDIVGYYENENYDDQFTATFTIGNMTRGNAEDDLPRTEGQKSEDALTLVTIDTTHRKLYLVRVGAEISDSFVKREDTCITY